MQIHITSDGENITDIAKKYGTSEENIRNANELYGFEPTEGTELLLLTPTRTYTAQPGDTPESICLRFGIRKNDLMILNPTLASSELLPGQTVNLRYGDPPYGMSAANGYFFKGCSEDRLRLVMPYLTYVTFASAVADEGGVRKSFNDEKLVRLASEEEKIPLIRVYDRYTERYQREKDLLPFADGLIALATDGGYKGIVLSACELNNSAKEFVDFLMILRKKMIGCDLILITEINEQSPLEFSEYADGSVLYYPKYAMNEPRSFEEGEREILSDFACRGESAKTFVDLPALAMREGRCVSIGEANAIAMKNRYTINHNESTLLSHFSDRKQGEYRFESLKGIKAMLDLIREYGYMGVCFDIMNTPLSQLLMYNSLFKTSYHTNVRSREGCSRAREE